MVPEAIRKDPVPCMKMMTGYGPCVVSIGRSRKMLSPSGVTAGDSLSAIGVKPAPCVAFFGSQSRVSYVAGILPASLPAAAG